MSDPNTPQELVIFQCAFVFTGEGTQKRPRLLILSAPSVEGVDTTRVAEQWIQAVKAQNAFPTVNNLIDGTGLEVSLPSVRPVDKPTPLVKVNTEHPVFKGTHIDAGPLPEPVEVAHGN